MKIKNVLKQLRNADENTLTEIQDNYSADWEMDELFDKCYEKYLSKSNFKEDEESITVQYHAEKRVSSLNLIVHRIVPAATCFGLIAVSAVFMSTHSLNNKTESQNEYNNYISTTFEKNTEEVSITSIPSDTDVTAVSEAESRITATVVTEYAVAYSETFKSSERQNNSVTSFSKTESVKYSDSSFYVKNETSENNNTGTDYTVSESVTVNPQVSVPFTYVTTVTPSVLRKITLDDILRLSHKGTELDWSDFNDYMYTDVGSGLYVCEYMLEENEYKDYVLRISGIPEKKPCEILLVPVEHSIRYCDITSSSEEQIKSFINESDSEPGDNTENDDYNDPLELLENDFESYVQKYKFDSAEFDIDNDGFTEHCIITYGPSSGVITYIISSYSNGILKYRNTLALERQIASFKVNGETAYVRMAGTQSDGSYFEYRKIYTEGNNIVIENMNPAYEWYWGDAEYNPYIF